MASESSAVGERPDQVHAPPADQFEELSEILLGPERSQIAQIRRRLDNSEARTRDVASVLPDAVRQAPVKQLPLALQRTVEEAIGLSVRSNPRMLAEALFPILGRAIRRAIAAEFAGMTESLNQVLEQQLSVRSLRWRIEALRTHRSYAEIVILRSQLYRVERVYLIHRQTGLLLEHVSSDGKDGKDPEAISGMLTALQDFVHDTVEGTEEDNLETMRVGEYTVVLAYVPEAILAGFVRGVPPRNLNRLFQDRLDSIQVKHAHALAGFTGDTAGFEDTRTTLEKCLVGQGEPSLVKQGASRGARILLYAIPLLAICIPLLWWIQSIRTEHRWQDLVQKIREVPGIVVTSATEHNGSYSISGLRDPLAADPVPIVQSSGIPAALVGLHLEPYYSLLPAFAGRRGYAEAKTQLERASVSFASGIAIISPEQRVQIGDIASRISSMRNAAASVGLDVTVEVAGSADSQGSGNINAALARARAVAVREALVESGAPATRIVLGTSSAACGACRAVTFIARENGR